MNKIEEIGTSGTIFKHQLHPKLRSRVVCKSARPEYKSRGQNKTDAKNNLKLISDSDFSSIGIEMMTK